MYRLPPILSVFFPLILAGASLRAVEPSNTDSRPNLLLILVDDLGWGDLASYGSTDMRTPHIDRLIAGGMRFDNFYANCPVCSPTRASLLSGRYPELVGVPGVIRTHAENSWGFLDPKTKLLPEILGEAGYHTALVGKWHLGLESPNTPSERGFDHVHGFLGDMMDDYYNHRRHGNNYMRFNEQTIEPEGHATDLFSDWACDYLEGRAARAKEGHRRPFFLYLAYNAPHTPIQPPDKWLEHVKQREAGITERRAKLVAFIEHLDDGIGRVLAKLEATGQSRDTLVVFTSDNGGQENVGANNGPWRAGKGTMYEGGLRVPAGIRWPGKIEPGSRSAGINLVMDLFPTLCEAAGVEPPEEIDSRSFLPTLLGETPNEEPRTLFFHRREGGNGYHGHAARAVRQGEWKLVQNSPFAPYELYNLADDPAEEKNLAGQNTQVLGRLTRALSAQIQRGGAVPWQPAGRRDTPQEAP